MPVAEFPGTRNWGYDGVNLYAPQSSYGGPNGLKRLVDACHGHGLAVILDVVYNHLGPDGNFLGDFGPYFTRRYGTPWGDAINYDDADSEPVRRYFIDNALYLFTEMHVDALRLDAIHGIYDFGPRHLLAEMKRAADAVSPAVGRPLGLIAESALNDPRIVEPREAGGYALDAQWSDDFHHAAFMLLARGRGGFAPYLYDFGRLDDLPREPRPDRQWRARRTARPAVLRWRLPGGDRPPLLLAQPAPALHGPGAGGGDALLLLHQSRRSGAGRGRQPRPARRVRALR